MRRMDNKAVLVTGAGSGIGRASAVRLAEEGASLFLTDVNIEGLEETARHTRQIGAKTGTMRCDVSDESATKASVDACVRELGRIDVLCNIAGMQLWAKSHEVTRADWDRVLAVNLTGTFLMCRDAIPHLLETQGAIVNMASTAGLAGLPWSPHYCASKGGVLALTRALAVEYGRQGLRVNAICPGSIATGMTQGIRFPEGVDFSLIERAQTLDRQFRGPEVIAAAVAFLASSDAAHVNGEHIRVDSGTLA